ncbi:MAG TPA: ABC transporter substrate-binding protein [Aestuariivirgaceae bacterium]|jgi:NitT/TauT family transport system substrate-binding protein
MHIIQNRRDFLTCLSAAGAIGFFNVRHSNAAGEQPPETTTVRLSAIPSACAAPLYLAEDLLREEGFTDIQYVPSTGTSMVADGEVDFDMLAAVDYLPLLDAGKSLIVLSGIHGGCFELRGNDSIKAITDLRGKRVGVTTPLGFSADHMLVSVMAAYVGLNPRTDIIWVTDPKISQAELFNMGKVDAFVGFPPDPSQPCMQSAGQLVVSTGRDRPWSDYFCCMVAANPNFMRNNPVSTKRALRAILKATDICHKEPEKAVQRMVEQGFSAMCARMMLNDVSYGIWRDHDPEDTVRFFALRLHETGMIKSPPNEIISKFTYWQFLNDIKNELS